MEGYTGITLINSHNKIVMLFVLTSKSCDIRNAFLNAVNCLTHLLSNKNISKANL